MSDVAVRVENLGKKYLIRHQHQGRRYKALRDVLADRFQRLLPGRSSDASGNSQSSKEEFWALENVSFGIKQGEAVGIIGRNGAGKSTLLKLLSRITAPTRGRIELQGRVASLLEVGTGFHPELTGRENVFLNGSIMGMTRKEIQGNFDEIVAFAEVERFLDTPVKRYSSGMYMRLAFAVAAHLQPEILIVDEVLAVGDAQFQKKCLGKMEDVSNKDGRTVIFVSHNMSAVTRLCSRAILLASGQIAADGDTQQVSQHYQSVVLPRHSRQDWPDPARAPGSEVCRLRHLRVTDQNGEDVSMVDVTEPFHIEMGFEVMIAGSSLTPNFHFYNEQGECLFIVQDHEPLWRGKPRPRGEYVCRVSIPSNLLAEGWLSIGGALTTYSPFSVHCYAEHAIGVMVEDTFQSDSSRGDYVGPLPGLVRPLLKTTNEYHGETDRAHAAKNV